MTRLPRILLLSVLMPVAGLLSAQLPIVDITSVPVGGNQVEVRVRPDAFFDGLLSSIVFTLRWDASSGITLGSITQSSPQSQYCPITKSGSEQVSGQYRYQVFVGFGSIPFTSLGATWAPGEEVVLCRLNVSGGGAEGVALVNDLWTDQNNASYYLSLNGEDRTGEIYGITTVLGMGSVSAPSIRLAPNPASSSTDVVIDLPQAVPSAVMRLLDGAGRIVRTTVQNLPAGQHRTSIDLHDMSPGVYCMELELPSGRHVLRLVVEDTR